MAWRTKRAPQLWCSPGFPVSIPAVVTAVVDTVRTLMQLSSIAEELRILRREVDSAPAELSSADASEQKGIGSQSIWFMVR